LKLQATSAFRFICKHIVDKHTTFEFLELRELERFQTAKVTFRVNQGHWYWGHSTGHTRFHISLPL